MQNSNGTSPISVTNELCANGESSSLQTCEDESIWLAVCKYTVKGMSSYRGMGVIVGTRFWGRSEADWNRLYHFLSRAQKVSQGIVVLVNSAHDHLDTKARLDAIQCQWIVPVHVENIDHWSGVTGPLNHLIKVAFDKFQASTLLIQSPEVSVQRCTVSLLKDTLCSIPGCLVVGHWLPGHQPGDCPAPFKSNEELDLGGLTSPWNTLAMWDVKRLQRTGFAECADKVEPAGMEEVGTIALQNKLYGDADSKAVVVHATSGEQLRWDCEFRDNGERRRKHESKMQSKVMRAQVLLDQMDVRACDIKVTHIWQSGDKLQHLPRVVDQTELK